MQTSSNVVCRRDEHASDTTSEGISSYGEYSPSPGICLYHTDIVMRPGFKSIPSTGRNKLKYASSNTWKWIRDSRAHSVISWANKVVSKISRDVLFMQPTTLPMVLQWSSERFVWIKSSSNQRRGDLLR